jgi:hemerythrin-like metal-binding protein
MARGKCIHVKPVAAGAALSRDGSFAMTQMDFSATGNTSDPGSSQGALGGFQFESFRNECAQMPHLAEASFFRPDDLISAKPATWGTETTSGVQAMDRLHYDVFQAMDELSRSTDQEFGGTYRAFVRRIEQAFRQEACWMEEIDFPASNEHQEQHARVLGALHHIHSRVMAGEVQAGREVADHLLPQWFALHLSTQDMILAVAMQTMQAESAAPAPSQLLAGAFTPL